jgi:dTDP-glucose 4,6-dehydratase
MKILVTGGAGFLGSHLCKGEQNRSFCYVDDFINGLIKLFFTESAYKPINLGNLNPTSILGLAEEILKTTKSNLNSIFIDLPLDDPKLREPNITKAQEKLGWHPEVSRQVDLSMTIEDFRNRMEKVGKTAS